MCCIGSTVTSSAGQRDLCVRSTNAIMPLDGFAAIVGNGQRFKGWNVELSQRDVHGRQRTALCSY